MRVLVICSGNPDNQHLSFEEDKVFVHEQIQAIRKKGIKVDIYKIIGKGIKGYLKNLKLVKQQIRKGNYDLIHAHYGLSGLLAVMQRIRPVVVTFHGSDVNLFKNNLISSLVSFSAGWCIFVASKLYNNIFFKPKKRYSIIPCGVDMDVFYPKEKNEARRKLGLSDQKRYILFTSAFSNKVKNFPLAKKSVKLIENVTLLELKDYSRNEVNLLLNAVDLLLMTSICEGSPQVIKEAMACNCPIVSTDVGDVKELFENVAGCYLTSFKLEDVVKNINKALEFGKRTQGIDRVKCMDNSNIADEILKIYSMLRTKKDV
jgi:glycosyltransferase involved in cell wall biosynthesis